MIEASWEPPETAREKLEFIAQATRANIIQDILGHPEYMPSLLEIVEVNPSKSKSTLRNHLQRLVAAGIVSKVRLPDDERSRDLPYTFFTLSEEGLELLRTHDFLVDKFAEIRHDYGRTERSPAMQLYEDAPRPDIDVSHLTALEAQ